MSIFLEKTLEDIIMCNIDKMPSKGLDVFYKNTANQTQFSSNIFDIFTWEEVDDVLHCRIIELKKDCADESAFWQVFNYKYDLFFLLSEKYKHIKNIEIDIILIASSFKYNLQIISGYVGLRLFEYKYDIDGIIFKEQEWCVNDTIVKVDYERKVLNGLDVSKKESFTDDVIKLARGKMSS